MIFLSGQRCPHHQHKGFIVNFITDNKLPLGQWMETGVDWLTINA
ncbi:choline ABC transporter permease subunit, partial [Vibrio sp. 2033]|nr:choline ABC transporter permease subunit [Vibrio sp. 2033]